MKRIVITAILFFLFAPFAFSQSNYGQIDTLNVINATAQSKLFFNTISQPLTNNCLPEFRDYNQAGISGYCILDAAQSLFLPDYVALEGYYPSIKINVTGLQYPISPTSANIFMGSLDFDVYWSYFIYKVDGELGGGAHIGFSDTYPCHGLPNSHIDPLITGSAFMIGSQRYFIVTEN